MLSCAGNQLEDEHVRICLRQGVPQRCILIILPDRGRVTRKPIAARDGRRLQLDADDGVPVVVSGTGSRRHWPKGPLADDIMAIYS
jgi:hypothetical protein